MGNKIFIFGVGAFVILVVGLAIWSVPEMAAREKECKEKEGVMIRSSSGLMCIKKEVVIK